MKNLLAAIVGAIDLFCVVVLMGAVWGGENRLAIFDLGIESHSSTDDVVIAALSGGIAFALCGGLPAVIIGAIAGPLAVAIVSRRRITLYPFKQRRPFLALLTLFADSLLLLALVIVATALAWMMGLGFLFVFFHGGE
jgi:hypothetical protein